MAKVTSFTVDLGQLQERLAEDAGLTLSNQATDLCVRCGHDALPRCYSEAGRREFKITGLCEECFDNLFQEEDAEAEPKPTPSTDIGCEGCGEPVYLTRGYGYSHVDTTLNVSCDARPKSNHPSVPKPQPDSSSISTEPMPKQLVSDGEIEDLIATVPEDWETSKMARELQAFRKRAVEKSISKDQTFEEWLEGYSRRVVDNGATPISPMERSIARAAWNAAKGQR